MGLYGGMGGYGKGIMVARYRRAMSGEGWAKRGTPFLRCQVQKLDRGN